jgi:hypothetical protein
VIPLAQIARGHQVAQSVSSLNQSGLTGSNLLSEPAIQIARSRQ